MGALGVLQADQHLRGWLALFSFSARLVTSISAVTLILGLQYYIGPNRRQKFLDILPGALVATVLWLLATLLFGWYVRHLANYNVLYGSIGGAIALLVWMYLLSIISLYGCEFNAERERLAGPGHA